MPNGAGEERLDELFRCEHFEKTLAYKHCLRRQLERRQVKHPRTMKLQAGEPMNGYCTTACAQGREIRSRFSGVPLENCGRCGAAQVGAEAAARPCEACEAARVEDKHAPARGFLPPKRAPESTVIWGKDAPDAPIGPPPATSPHSGFRPTPAAPFTMTDPELAAKAARRAREAAAAPPHLEAEKRAEAPATHAPAPDAAPANPEVAPAQPAEEEAMAKTCSKCGKGLRADNTSGACGNRRACAERAGGAKRVAPKLPPAPAGSRPTRRGGRVRLQVVAKKGDVKDLLAQREDLLARLEAVDAAIQESLATRKAELARLEAAVQAATARARSEAA